MNTYESEKKELYDWLLEKDKEYHAAEKKEEKTGLKRDSEANYQFQLTIQEYNKKLRELKKKYGIK